MSISQAIHRRYSMPLQNLILYIFRWLDLGFDARSKLVRAANIFLHVSKPFIGIYSWLSEEVTGNPALVLQKTFRKKNTIRSVKLIYISSSCDMQAKEHI